MTTIRRSVLSQFTIGGRELARGMLALLYPPLCLSCSRSLTEGEVHFCNECRRLLTGDRRRSCPRCASTVGPHANLLKGCHRCRDVSFAFEGAVRLGVYEGLLRDVVLRMKQQTGETLAEVVGDLWARHSLDRLQQLQTEAVVPIPLHWGRRWARGYNQSEALAQAVASVLSLPCRPGWLRRKRSTPFQTQQVASARWDNVRQAFVARPCAELRGKAVLLIDDVLTTGSTASAAASALRAAGAGRVWVAVLTHGPL